MTKHETDEMLKQLIEKVKRNHARIEELNRPPDRWKQVVAFIVFSPILVPLLVIWYVSWPLRWCVDHLPIETSV